VVPQIDGIADRRIATEDEDVCGISRDGVAYCRVRQAFIGQGGLMDGPKTIVSESERCNLGTRGKWQAA